MRPKDLFAHWPEVERRLRSRPRWLLGLDCDGTLSAIAPHPGEARVDGRVRGLLKAFRGRRDCPAAVISGRALKDLKRLVGVPGLVYAGNHGIEIQGPGVRFLHPKARAAARELRGVSRSLARGLEGVPGARLEDKRFSLSVHYRQTPAGHLPRVEEAVRRALKGVPSAGRRRFELVRGKKVLEVRPRLRWEKGDALRLLSRGRLPIFVGDDAVDEHAFRAARAQGGLAVRVGRRGPTEAAYFVAGQGRVPELLERILRTLQEAGG